MTAITGRSVELSIQAFLADRERVAKAMIVCWYLSMGMLVLGYLIMAYLLFFR
jgi:hypothetical protein